MAARISKFLVAAAAVTAASVAAAQSARVPAPAPAQTQQRNSATGLRLPNEVTVFGGAIPSVVKASAIVNGTVITQTDIDQRLALLAISQGGQIPKEEVERLRVQVLRNLIDETLQVQAAKAAEITVAPADIDRTIARVASNLKQSPEQMAAYLKANGSSIRSMRRQIEGEIAWQRLQRAKIESRVSVGDEEVKAVIDRMNAAKGTEEFRVGEIFLTASPANQAEVLANAQKIVAALQQGASFAGYARQFSEASTAAVGGDLGWVRPEQLPESLSNVVRQMGPGQLSLKQVSIAFPSGTTRAAAEPVLARFAAAAQNVGGCGGADKLAADFKGDVVTSDGVKLRELPPALQQMMLPMQVGQATRPFGSLEDGVRILVICGRDEGGASEAPSTDQVYAQLQEERVDRISRRYLRDLRRDAVIDFR